MRCCTAIVATALGLVAALFLTQAARASDYGPTSPTKDLQALIAAEPEIGTALEDSLRQADWAGIDTLDEFYDYVDHTIRLVPTTHSLLTEVRPFFWLVGQSQTLEENATFQEWVKRYVASYGEFLDTTASAAGLQSFYDNPAFRIDDYYVGPSGWLTFNQFFARRVKAGKRPIAGLGDGKTVVSPSDGIFLGSFPVGEDSELVVKDIHYSIGELLHGSDYSDAFAGGQFVHTYQSITDYHHFHVPFTGVVVEAKNVAGYVWLDLVRNEDDTFTAIAGEGYQWRQERGILVLQTETIGLVAIIPVGMGLVGDVILTPEIGAELYKGENFGFFQFGGSDVIMVFQKGMVEITAQPGERYLQGQEFGHSLATE